MESKAFEQYASMLVDLVGIQKGQGLVVKGEPVHWPVVTAIAAAAYHRGAKFVEPVVDSAALHRVRVENAPTESLEFIPESRKAWQEQFIREKWAVISIKSPDDPDILAGIDPERHGTLSAAYRRADLPWRERLMADEQQWLIAAAPTPKWAAKVLDTTPSRESQIKLWQLLKAILRLDHEDPVGFWKEYGKTLQKRGALLTGLELRAVRFTGEGTELTVGIPERAIWVGGGSRTPEGVEFMANLPTEEVFTAPDFRKTEGIVRATRPVTVLGDLVEEAVFTFERGKVVHATASRGEETLKRFLDMDEGSRYLGEVALVDSSSPIFQSGYTFYNTLLDENAACHIALGSAYPDTIEGGLEMSAGELQTAGLNKSLQHTDFMIGSESVDVVGIRRDGGEVEIMRNGDFVLPEQGES
ncbi:MAG: aminopeptidase [Spirochaetaceae bacterium]